MTHDSTTATAFTAFDFLCPVRAEVTAEIKAGKDIDDLAAELAESEASGDLTETEIATALRALRADDYKAAAETGTEDGIEHADDLASGPTGEGASVETLRACASPGNDWGNSSDLAWSLIGGAEKFGADAYLAYCAAYEAAARARCGELADEAEATTLDVALEFAREEGIAWAKEIEGEFHGDSDRDNWLASADRDPRGWWNKCAFDTVRDRVSAEIWDEYSSELSEACADACAEAIREAAGDAEDEDDGQPSDLQEHEDFAHDNDF